MGKRTVLHLVERGIHVIMAVKDVEKGKDAKHEIVYELFKMGHKNTTHLIKVTNGLFTVQ